MKKNRQITHEERVSGYQPGPGKHNSSSSTKKRLQEAPVKPGAAAAQKYPHMEEEQSLVLASVTSNPLLGLDFREYPIMNSP